MSAAVRASVLLKDPHMWGTYRTTTGPVKLLPHQTCLFTSLWCTVRLDVKVATPELFSKRWEHEMIQNISARWHMKFTEPKELSLNISPTPWATNPGQIVLFSWLLLNPDSSTGYEDGEWWFLQRARALLLSPEVAYWLMGYWCAHHCSWCCASHLVY